MEKTEEIQKFENILTVKNQLIKMELDEIVDVYKNLTMDNYKAFLVTIIWMLDNEQAFFCIDKYITDKVCSVIDARKDEIQDEKLYDIINRMKKYLNSIDSAEQEQKDKILEQYYLYHKEVRAAKFDGSEGFINTLGLDAYVYYYLRGEKELPEISEKDTLVMFSVAYFIEACPSFFMDEDVYNRTMMVLDDIRKRTSFFDKAMRKALSMDKKIIESIYKGE